MTATTLIDALALPRDARVDRRVPKRLLLEQGAPTAADRRRIQTGIDDLLWVAALKPTTIGVPAFRDEIREYLEIAVVSVELRGGGAPTRLLEVLHRAIPHPVLVAAHQGDAVYLSLAHKRRSQGETGKVVVEDVRTTSLGESAGALALEGDFLRGLALARLPARDLQALYQGWIDAVAALEAGRITGRFAPAAGAARAAARHAGLETHSRLARELSALRLRARRETQVNRRVELNLEIQRLEAALAAAAKDL